MTARLACVLAATGMLALAGCGGSSSQSSVPGGANPDAVKVIKGWVDALRAGHVDEASSFFSVPTVVQNGTPALELTTRQEVVQFNESLPCGAKLTRAEPHGRFILATFVLTERPGPGAGQCGPGVGQTAQTAFAIRGGHITEWRRFAEGPPSVQTGTAPVV